MTSKEKEIVVGLDIGTTKVCAVVTTKDENGETHVLGFGSTICGDGMARADIININQTAEAIKKVAFEASEGASYKINSVTVGVSGIFVNAKTRTISQSVNRDNIIKHSDIHRLVETAKREFLGGSSYELEIIHLLPQEFTIDGQEGIREPVGMAGQEMKSNVYIIAGNKSKLENIRRSVKAADLGVHSFIFEPIASSLSVVQENERKSGVVVVDIGGGTTDVIIFTKGIIRYTKVLKIASYDVTEDIAKVLKILDVTAEELKLSYGNAYAKDVEEIEDVPIIGLEGQKTKSIKKRELANIIEARMTEILELVRDVIDESGLNDSINAGLILTGGGALIPGTKELAEEILSIDVRIGYPRVRKYEKMGEGLNNPKYATVLGLAEYMHKTIEDQKKLKEEESLKKEETEQLKATQSEKTVRKGVESDINLDKGEQAGTDSKMSIWKWAKNWFDQI